MKPSSLHSSLPLKQRHTTNGPLDTRINVVDTDEEDSKDSKGEKVMSKMRFMFMILVACVVLLTGLSFLFDTKAAVPNIPTNALPNNPKMSKEVNGQDQFGNSVGTSSEKFAHASPDATKREESGSTVAASPSSEAEGAVNQHNNHLPDQQKKKLLKVAVAISITGNKEGFDIDDRGYVDSAGVLAESVRYASALRTNKENDPYELEVEMVAIVHPKIGIRKELHAFGFRVIERDVPVDVDKIQNDYYKKELIKSGCCAEKEFLKLWAFMLFDYDWVLHLDSDALVLQNIDELFFDDSFTFAFTYDYAMDSRGKSKDSKGAPPVQGGLMLVKPDEGVFNQIVETAHEGDFRPGTGWAGSKIGWCWGGQTIQGIMAYYANALAETGSTKQLDICTYNNMAQQFRKECPKEQPFKCGLEEDDSVRCSDVKWEQAKTFHFTECPKPWGCHTNSGGHEICRKATEMWWDRRQDLQKRLGLQETPYSVACEKRRYTPIDLDNIA